MSRLPQEAGRGDILVGIPDGRGESRRRPSESPRVQRGCLAPCRAEAARNLQAMLARSTQDPTAAARWIGSMADLVGDLDETTAGEFTFQLAHRLFQSGHWELAAETFALLPKRYPKHPLTPAALVWLVQYYSSGEVTARLTMQPTYGLVAATGQKPLNPRESAAVVPVTAETPVQSVDSDLAQTVAKRSAEAARFAAELEKLSPGALAEPPVKFSLASACASERGGRRLQSVRAVRAAGDRTTPGWRRHKVKNGSCVAAAHRPRRRGSAPGPPPSRSWTANSTTRFGSRPVRSICTARRRTTKLGRPARC